MSGPDRTATRARRRSATRSVTLSDVAAAAGVSAQTVSRVVRDPDAVAEDTRSRVVDAIRRTGYVPNLAASNLASNRSRTVAAVLPAVSASVFAETVQAFSAALAPHDYQIFLGATDYRPEQEEALLRRLLGRRPDGVLLVGTEHTPGTRALLAAAEIPVVETWSWTEDPIDLLVGFSNAEATAALVRHLIATGRRRITFASRQRPGDARAAERLAGFTGAVTDGLGGPVRVVDAGDRPATMDTGVELLDAVLREYPDSDAVVFASDVYAAGALLACVRRGIAVPDRLAVAGFGDFEPARHLVPALTTVSVPNTVVGRTAAELLLARMSGDPVPEPALDVGFEIVVREST